MASLSARDLKFVIDMIYRVNLCESAKDAAQCSLSCASMLIPSKQQTFTIFDLSKGDFYVTDVLWHGKPPEHIDKYIENGYGEKDMLFNATYSPTETTCYRDTDYFTQEELWQTFHYREIYAEEGIAYVLRAIIVRNGRAYGELTLFRSEEEGDFSTRDVDVLSVFAPHVTLKYSQLYEGQKAGKSEELESIDLGEYGLTTREEQVILLYSREGSFADIAQRLNVSSATVKKHLYNAYKKLGINNRVQLFAFLEKTKRV